MWVCLCARTAENKVRLGEAGACAALVAVLQAHPKSAGVCERACGAIANVAVNRANKARLRGVMWWCG